jgi:hypothetical protein
VPPDEDVAYIDARALAMQRTFDDEVCSWTLCRSAICTVHDHHPTSAFHVAWSCCNACAASRVINTAQAFFCRQQLMSCVQMSLRLLAQSAMSTVLHVWSQLLLCMLDTALYTFGQL